MASSSGSSTRVPFLESELRRFIDQLSFGVGVHRDGRSVYSNPALVKLLGYEHWQELVGRDWRETVDMRDHDLTRKRIAGKAGYADAFTEVRLVRRDGTTVDVEVEPGQTFDIDGAPARIVAIRDLTESRRQEGQLVQSERMASVGVVAAGVAHEINNPLTWLHASLSALAKDFATIEASPAAAIDLVRRMKESLAAAVEGTERVQTIVRDLRTLSKPEDDSVEPVDVTDVMRTAVRLAAKQLAPEARLVEEYGNVPTVLANAARLGQVFLNLVVNAAQAVADGGSERPEVRVRTYVSEHGMVVAEVADSGPGIPGQLLPRIFEPFFTTKTGEGTGLGLAISHRIVTRLGGQIAVESVEGGGTTFSVVLRPME